MWGSTVWWCFKNNVICFIPSWNLLKSHSIDLFSFACKLPIADHVMFWRDFFLCVSENYSFIFTRICLNLKEIILKGTVTGSTLGQQTNEAKEVYRPYALWRNTPERQYGSCSHAQIQDVKVRDIWSIWKLNQIVWAANRWPSHIRRCQHYCHLNFPLRGNTTPYWIRSRLQLPQCTLELQKHCFTSLCIRSIVPL